MYIVGRHVLNVTPSIYPSMSDAYTHRLLRYNKRGKILPLFNVMKMHHKNFVPCFYIYSLNLRISLLSLYFLALNHTFLVLYP